MKGILLAGGSGNRLYPITAILNKHLLPVYDKPMIYYPLSTLMFAGIQEILIISRPQDVTEFKKLFHDGRHLGMNISYEIQHNPAGIAQALIIAESFIGLDSVCLILGDNIFYGEGLPNLLRKSANLQSGAKIFGYWVKDPVRFGIAELNENGAIVNIVEKPSAPKSHYAIPGLYFYDNHCVELAKKLHPSVRGELEITDLNREYLNQGKLDFEIMGRGMAWLDTGTPESLIDATNFISTIEMRQGLKVSCIEEIAYRLKFITKSQLQLIYEQMPLCDYYDYLVRIVSDS